ncbi:hypothetical protein ZIOFF_027576 [Zingiber officinale]|uniref:Uncharacterized protein n=1 Tax=Zingiber officinale TaxID=94328 RepID=A0A8J5L9A4_ZINOF|nr:hypothetical protein ZIOFF_027576 [Zingiber officinale]
MSQCYRDIDAAEHEEKHRRYEALYARRLRAKYFSKKAVDGVFIHVFLPLCIDGLVQDHLLTQLNTWKRGTNHLTKQKPQALPNRNRLLRRAVSGFLKAKSGKGRYVEVC